MRRPSFWLSPRGRIWCVEALSCAQRRVVRNQPFEFLVEGRFVGQIRDADRAATDFVFVGRANAALGRADLGFVAGRAFAGCIQVLVPG